MKKKIVVVVADGGVETVFIPEEYADLDVDVVDFDAADEDEQVNLGDYVDTCRETMKEIVCQNCLLGKKVKVNVKKTFTFSFKYVIIYIETR